MWTAFGLLPGSAALAFGDNGDKATPIAALRARCPTTRNLAPDAFESMAAASASQLDERQQRIRGNLRAEGPPPNAEVVLRAFAGGSVTQNERSETATLLWRLPDGSWHFIEDNFYPHRSIAPPPPPARLTDEAVEAARHSVAAGTLDGEQARALNALLADPCLDAEPSIVAGALPLRAGIPPMDACYDAVAQTVEVVRAGARRVYVQTCPHFLAGELIEVALYPHAQGAAPATPASQSLASLERARRYADQVLRASYGGQAWLNATEAAGGYAFIHRASGFRCAGTQPYDIQLFGPDPDEPTADGGRCLHESSLPVRGGVIRTEWQVARRQAPSDVKRRVRGAADDWFSGNYGSAARARIRTRSVTFDGVRMACAEVAGEPHVDARDDELTVVVGAEHDGWTLVARATGSAADPAAVEAAAIREWHRALEARAVGSPR